MGNLIDIKTYVSEKVDKMAQVIAIGDFVESDMPGAAETLDKILTYLKLRGYVGVNFEDVYAALNILEDGDVEEVYNFAMTKGMPVSGII